MRTRRIAGLPGAALIGYLLGTVPTADVASHLATGGKIDLRHAGSGNPGGANAAAVLGAQWGYSVMGVDIAKAALACRLAGRLAGDVGAHTAGAAAVLGHCFPIWQRFRGGKGVGCSAGQCLATFPAYFPIDIAVAAVTASGTARRRALTATAVASVTWVLSGMVWWRKQLPNAWGPAPSPALPAAAAVSSAVILYRFVSAERR